MSELFAGIDGGQSSTIALIGDEQGRVLGRGTAGPADEVGAGADSTRLRYALRDSLADACRNGDLPYESQFAAIVAGVSGYEGRIYGAMPQMPTQRFMLLHDAPVAHAGALAGEPGVVAIAGTGSVVYARDEHGESCTLGGWGYLFGDEGSAFGIVRESLALLMKGKKPGNALRRQWESEKVCKFFGVGSLRELARAFYAGEITRDGLASYAPEAIKHPLFRALARRGADQLAGLVRVAAHEMKAPKVAFVGGLFTDEPFRIRMTRNVAAWVPGALIVEPAYEPAAGALLLAYRELGLHVPELRS